MFRWVRRWCLLALCSSVSMAHAGGLSVSPISVTLEAARPAAAVTLNNDTSDSKVIQVNLMRWTHVQGQDQFAVADEMLANPPLFRIPAGGKQIVRVGLHPNAKADFTQERTYRLFLEEVPDAAAASPATPAPGAGVALRLLLRFGIPVFVAPEKPAAQAMRWSLTRDENGALRLSVTNDSNVHLRLSEVQLQADKHTLKAGSFAYVFAGETHAWTLTPETPWPSGTVAVSARTDAGWVHASLPLPKP